MVKSSLEGWTRLLAREAVKDELDGTGFPPKILEAPHQYSELHLSEDCLKGRGLDPEDCFDTGGQDRGELR